MWITQKLLVFELHCNKVLVFSPYFPRDMKLLTLHHGFKDHTQEYAATSFFSFLNFPTIKMWFRFHFDWLLWFDDQGIVWILIQAIVVQFNTYVTLIESAYSLKQKQKQKDPNLYSTWKYNPKIIGHKHGL